MPEDVVTVSLNAGPSEALQEAAGVVVFDPTTFVYLYVVAPVQVVIPFFVEQPFFMICSVHVLG